MRHTGPAIASTAAPGRALGGLPVAPAGRCRQGSCGTRTCDNWVCDSQHCDTYGECDQWQCNDYVCDTWSDPRYYEAWTFTTGSTATHIDLTVAGTWTGGARSYVALFNGTNFGTTPVASNTAASTTSPAKLSVNLNANTTYYVVVAANATNQTGTYTLASSQELTGYDPATRAIQCFTGTFSGSRLLPAGSTVPIGSIPQAQVKIRVNKADRTGVIQQTFNQVRYGFMYVQCHRGKCRQNTCRL